MELTDYTQYALALVFVLALIGLASWVMRRLGVGAGGGGRRGARVSVLEAAIVDKRRRLVLVRRDNVEHLVMIGGGQDVVIESNIQGPSLQRRPAGHAARGQREPAAGEHRAAVRPGPIAEPELLAHNDDGNEPATQSRQPNEPPARPAAAPAARPERSVPRRGPQVRLSAKFQAPADAPTSGRKAASTHKPAAGRPGAQEDAERVAPAAGNTRGRRAAPGGGRAEPTFDAGGNGDELFLDERHLVDPAPRRAGAQRSGSS